MHSFIEFIHKIVPLSTVMRKPHLFLTLFIFLHLTAIKVFTQSIDSYDAKVDSVVEIANKLMYRQPDSVVYIVQNLLRNNTIEPTAKKGRIYNTIGAAYFIVGKLDSSEYYYSQDTALYSQLDYANALSGLGGIYAQRKQNELAIELDIKAAAIYEALGEQNFLAGALNNIANILTRIADYETAREYYRNAITIHLKDSALNRLLPNYYNLADNFHQANLIDSATYYGKKTLSTALEANSEYGEGMAKGLLAKIALTEENYFKAYDLSKQASTTMAKLGDSASYYAIKVSEMKALAGLNKISKSNEIALAILSDTAKIQVNLKPELFTVLYENARKQEDYQSALIYLEKLKSIEDEINNTKKDEKIVELETRYETQRKQNEIGRLKVKSEVQQLQINQSRLLFGIIILVLISLVTFGYLLYKQRLTKKGKEALDLKQKLLRVQLNPHFMFNSLNAIQNLVYEEADKIKTADYLARFSQLTRQILELNKRDFISINEELKFIENYLIVQQIRFDDPFKYEINVSDEVIQENYQLPPMITQPFLENAIEHGIITKNGDGEIKLQISATESHLLLIITDNGVGREAASFDLQTKKHRSLATKITLERLEILQHNFKSIASMDITDIEEDNLITGTKVFFKIPLKFA